MILIRGWGDAQESGGRKGMKDCLSCLPLLSNCSVTLSGKALPPASRP